MRKCSKPEELLDHTAGNLFSAKRVGPDDVIYVVTVKHGRLYLLGKLCVARVCGLAEAAKILHRAPESLWDASDHVIALSATTMKFDRSVSIETTEQLSFVGKDDIKFLKFKEPGHLDEQTLRGVREIHNMSVQELDRLLPPLQEVMIKDLDNEVA